MGRAVSRLIGNRRGGIPLAQGASAALTFCVIVAGAPGGSAAASDSTLRPQSAAGTIGLRLVDAPSTSSGDPRARLYIVDHLAPGAVIRRRVEVTNTTSSRIPIVLYPAAATIVKGSFVGADARTPNDVSTWTSVVPGASEIPAGGRLMATVTVTVPPDASAGERYGVVWAEARAGPAGGGGVTRVSRVGVRMYVSVGPGGPPAADFVIDSLTAGRLSDGRPQVRASVHNTGGRALDMSGALQLSAGPGGLSAGPFPAQLGTTLAIGDKQIVTIDLDKQLPRGPWEAEITLRSGLLERGAKATLTFPRAGQAAPVKTAPARPAWLFPLAMALVAMVLLGLAAFVVMRRRRNAH